MIKCKNQPSYAGNFTLMQHQIVVFLLPVDAALQSLQKLVKVKKKSKEKPASHILNKRATIKMSEWIAIKAKKRYE